MSTVTDRTFNPSGNPAIDEIKGKLIELEDAIMKLEPGRRRSAAITQLEFAGMMAVKAAAVGDK